MPNFSDVQKVLNSAINGWSAANDGTAPKLTQKHQDPNFGWGNKDQLLKAKAKGLVLIEAEKIGKAEKLGKDTNIVKALRDPNGVNNFGEMPDQGPFFRAMPYSSSSTGLMPAVRIEARHTPMLKREP